MTIRISRILRQNCAVVLAALLAGCANLDYYAQAVDGHMDIRDRTQPISTIIADPDANPALKGALAVVVKLRQFANHQLKLPDNQSFTTYADVGRPYAVWNVTAAPELSLELKKWCFVAIGCVTYRGFFSKAEAERFAEGLKAKGYDVTVGGVRAYSTLGWFKDPILNTFLGYSETELAQLMFHELAHQVVYVRDDSTFNESFATAVELEGVARWLNSNGTSEQRSAFDAAQKKKDASAEIMLSHRKRLEEVFASNVTNAEKRAAKARILAELRDKLSALEATTAGVSTYERWWAQRLNNAYLASISTYTHLVPAFQALLARQDGNIERFYETVKRISTLPEAERTSLLHRTVSGNRTAASSTP
ncbi:Predicted aminopeptidase [Nitrosospira sp. Nl5]|uniref:aminopeptidase n=1 Tax=Nitrosospira sp. Nl5 TaxID=200120 RepID=UPI00088B56C0|nr:aminopeptidase [Nitrosospira sp. Nl5]SCX90892.1 Predicted aminopeptidase [Nitrosospira sp. Nl5]